MPQPSWVSGQAESICLRMTLEAWEQKGRSTDGGRVNSEGKRLHRLNLCVDLTGPACAGRWLNTILCVSVGMFLDEINSGNSRLTHAEGSPDAGGPCPSR